MFKNLRIEWMKIKNYRVFQVFSILYMLGILIIIYIFYKIYLSLMGRVTGQEEGADFFNLFSSDNIWATVCFSTGFLLYLPGMIIINLFINEVNFKTHRQNIIDGWKRETFIYTKFQLILCMCIAIALMNTLATFIMCQVTNVTFTLGGLDILAFSFIQSFVYLSLALLLATVFRRSGVAIIVFFAYGLLLESFFMWVLWRIAPGGAQHFLPLQVADSLISFPGMDGIYGNNPGWKVMLPAAIAFAGLYVYLAVRKYKYDDL
jgi:ABC-2 type transport system permease protein